MKLHVMLTASLLYTVSVSAIGHEGTVSASSLLNAVSNANPMTSPYFITDENEQGTVQIDSMLGSVRTWTADMDIDCDGEYDARCQGDPTNQSMLACDTPVNPAETPFFVMPGNTTTWDWENDDVDFGQIAALIYNDKVEYTVYLDNCGLERVIGEASYAAAYNLGIDPAPDTGGTDGPVTYVLFTGPDARLSEADWTNHDAAIELGNQLAEQFLADYADTPIRQTQTAAFRKTSIAISKGRLDITNSGDWKAELIDMKGRQIASFSGISNGSRDIATIPAGIYVCRLSTGNAIETSRISITQ